MKLSKGFSLRNIAGEYIVVPVGEKNISFQGMITLNTCGGFLWEQLEKECTEEELVMSLMNTYEITREIACADVREFLNQLVKAKILMV